MLTLPFFASFHNNSVVIDWVNTQPLASVVTCLGDGHDGVWNIINQLAHPNSRRGVLDWFHLMENLYKVDGSFRRLRQGKNLLWKGLVEDASEYIEWLEEKLKAIESQIKNAVAFCEDWKQKQKLLTSVPGVGDDCDQHLSWLDLILSRSQFKTN